MSASQISPVSVTLSRKLKWMSFLCAIFIVFIHVQRPSDCFISRYVSSGISQVGVPFFFSAAGFFMFGHVDDEGWWRKEILKRLKTLVVPCMCLNLLWYPVFCGIHAIAVRYCGASDALSIMHFSWFNFLTGMSPIPLPWWRVGPTIEALWFLQALFLLAMGSICYFSFIRKSRVVTILLLAGVLLLWFLQEKIFVIPWMSGALSLRCLFYFMFGAGARAWRPVWHRGFRCIYMLLIGLAALLAFARVFALPSFMDFILYQSALVSLMLGLVGLMPDLPLPAFLRGNSFAIYVFHPMLIYLICAIFKLVKLNEFMYTQTGIILTVLACIVLSCVMAQFLRRFPSVARLFLGGR